MSVLPLTPLPLALQVPLAAALAVTVLTWVAEKLHQRRCRVVAHLASGPSGRLRRWVSVVPLVRALALGCLAWGLATLLFCSGGIFAQREAAAPGRSGGRQIVFVADLSPSMMLADAGPKGDQTRAQRLRDVVDAILSRLDGDLRFSVLAFYTTARPVVADARDPELVRNVFNGLPVWYVMKAGKTDLGAAVRETLKFLEDYPDDTATVFLGTDGDSVDLGPLPKPPGRTPRRVCVGGGGSAARDVSSTGTCRDRKCPRCRNWRAGSTGST